jgi:hypothetical protein
MGQIIKLGQIEAYIDEPEDVTNTPWDNANVLIPKYYGKEWRLPTLEELEYIKDLKLNLGILKNLDKLDDYWSSTPTMALYVPEDDEEYETYNSDPRWFYQVRIEKSPYKIKPFICHVSYYGNILPVRDI